MKKILITILILLLLLLTYMSLYKTVSIAGFKIESIADMENATKDLEKKQKEANELVDEEYPDEVETLEEAIKKLKIAKQKYDSKNVNNATGSALGTLEVNTYKIHYLWTRIGNYRKDRGIQSLTLDLESTGNKDIYNLKFTLIGSYSNIIQFLYDIEDDEELNFEPVDFVLTSDIEGTNYSSSQTQTNSMFGLGTNSIFSANIINTNSSNTNNTNNTNSTSNKNLKNDGGYTLKATFTVENVGITLD